METTQKSPTQPSAIELIDLDFELEPIVAMEHSAEQKSAATWTTCTTYFSAARCPTC